jgi:hypothetical protein
MAYLGSFPRPSNNESLREHRPSLPQPFLLPPPTATLFSFFVAGRSFSGCASRLERPTAEGTSGSAFSLGNCLISDLVVDKTDDKNAFLRQLGVSVI